MDPSLKPALIAATVSVLGYMCTAGLVFWQIGRQAKNAIKQNKKTEAMKLKLKVYEEISEVAGEVLQKELQFDWYVLAFVLDIDLYVAAPASGMQASPPRARWLTLQDEHDAFIQSANRLTGAIRRWAIIDPKLDLFRVGIEVALRDLSVAYGEYTSIAARTMPLPKKKDDPHGEIYDWSVPDATVMARLRSTSDEVRRAIALTGCYSEDFLIAIQNLLVGKLFNTKRKAREPIDQSFFPLQIDQYDAIMEHFKNKTRWGHDKKRADELARMRSTN